MYFTSCTFSNRMLCGDSKYFVSVYQTVHCTKLAIGESPCKFGKNKLIKDKHER